MCANLRPRSSLLVQHHILYYSTTDTVSRIIMKRENTSITKNGKNDTVNKENNNDHNRSICINFFWLYFYYYYGCNVLYDNGKYYTTKEYAVLHQEAEVDAFCACRKPGHSKLACARERRIRPDQSRN